MQLQLSIEKFKENPKVEEFIKEALVINNFLSQQLTQLCEKISLIHPLCIKTNALVDQAINSRLEFEEADDKITDYISWKNIEKGRATKLPMIEESHIEILFLEWETQLIKAERATSRAKATRNNIIELVNDNLHSANLIFECTRENLLMV